MSARDRLDRYEQDWDRHMRWRNPPNHAGGVAPGQYVQESSGFGRVGHDVAFREVPSELRERLAKRLESAIAVLVDEEHAKLLTELRLAAVAEAKATLEELKNEPLSPREAAFLQTGDPGP